MTSVKGVNISTAIMHNAILGDYPKEAQGTKELYNSWAKTIDNDCVVAGYNGPTAAVQILERLLPNKRSLIMDVACGTGLVGEQLVARGYSSFDGVDFSSESIKISQEKQIYRRLICDEISSRHKLDVADDTYDAAVCVGCFIPGHLTQDCFPELIRIVKPGGLIIIVMRAEYLETAQDFNQGKLEMAIQNFVQRGAWELFAREPVNNFFGGHMGVAFVFKLL